MGHVGYSTIVIVIIINKALFSVFYRYFLNTYDRDRPQSMSRCFGPILISPRSSLAHFVTHLGTCTLWDADCKMLYLHCHCLPVVYFDNKYLKASV